MENWAVRPHQPKIQNSGIPILPSAFPAPSRRKITHEGLIANKDTYLLEHSSLAMIQDYLYHGAFKNDKFFYQSAFIGSFHSPTSE